MNRPVCLLLFLPAFLAACATTPAPQVSDGRAVENQAIGFSGYRLPLVDGYTVVRLEEAREMAALQEWVQATREFHQRMGSSSEMTDDVFLRKGNRLIWFAVESTHTPIPFNRLSPDRRERLLTYGAYRFQRRAARIGEEPPKFSLARVAGRELLRTGLFENGEVEQADFAVMGKLNEFYHFRGVAEMGEGDNLVRDIEDLIRSLTF